MEEFSKYLTPGDDDKDWGLYLNVAGKTIIPPGTIYPSKSHPSGYYFTWDIGRILHEYQIVYITEGVSPTRFRTAAQKHKKRRKV